LSGSSDWSCLTNKPKKQNYALLALADFYSLLLAIGNPVVWFGEAQKDEGVSESFFSAKGADVDPAMSAQRVVLIEKTLST
jgi:hypothetical protein